MRGDENGAINVLESHPEFPFLATSGIDSDVKIWVPSNEKPPDLSGLVKCVKKNMQMRNKATDDLLDEEVLRLIMQRRLRSLRAIFRDNASSESNRPSGQEDESMSPNLELLSGESDEDDDEDGNTEAGRHEVFPCSPM